MSTAVDGLAGSAVAPVTALVERVFGAVVRLRDRVLAGRPEPATGSPPPLDVPDVRATALQLLAAHRDIAVGMGVILAPDAHPAGGRRVLWWQSVPGEDQPVALRVDLNPHSLSFYDYGSADWFSVPAASGGRHVDGPYVDVHGTGRYLLTFTVPVLTGTGFLGVVGADVPASRFESHVLRAWGRLDADVAIVNGEGRVVVSNSTRALTGDLLRATAPGVSDRREVPSLPWHVVAAPRD